MSIVVGCGCGSRFQAPLKYAGKQVRCPQCGGVIRVPSQAGPSSAPAAPAANPLGPASGAATPPASRAAAQPTAYSYSPPPQPTAYRQPAYQQPGAPMPPYAAGPMYAPPARPRKRLGQYLAEAGQFYRRQRRLLGIVLLILLPPSLCALSIVGGAIAIRGYVDHRTAKYASLNAELERFVSPPGVNTTNRRDGTGYIRGKYVIIDKDAGKIHPFHDGPDPYLAWNADEVDTVVWLRTDERFVGIYRREDDKDSLLNPKDTDAYQEVVTATIIDLAEKRIVGGFQIKAEVPEEIHGLESGRARVEKDEVMSRLDALNKVAPKSA